jgi:endo-1,3-1,4-beta-glycanase ExoK
VKFKSVAAGILCGTLLAGNTFAVTSAELYTNEGYQYGRFSARIQFAPGSGVVSSFFLWKDGSEQDDVFWNELDFEKLEAECRMESNTIYGDPEGLDPQKHDLAFDLCGEYHVYTYEWTPEYIAWLVDDVEIRRDTGEPATAFAENTPDGMQLRFNVWPGDETFGGEFDPAILPVYEYIDWVSYSSYANGVFQEEWREDFTDGDVPSGWSVGSWDSPKGLSTHDSNNVGFKDGYVILALTDDDATGFVGADPRATDTQAPPVPSTSGETSAPPTSTAPTATDSAQTAATSGGVTSAPASGTMAPADSSESSGCALTAAKNNRFSVLATGMLLMLGVWIRRRVTRQHRAHEARAV